MFICISIPMSSIIRWDKPLRPKELINLSTFASIPVTAESKHWKTDYKQQRKSEKNSLKTPKLKAIKNTRRVWWALDLACFPFDKILHVAGFCRPRIQHKQDIDKERHCEQENKKYYNVYIDKKEVMKWKMKLPDAIWLDTKLNHVEITSVCSRWEFLAEYRCFGIVEVG